MLAYHCHVRGCSDVRIEDPVSLDESTCCPLRRANQVLITTTFFATFLSCHLDKSSHFVSIRLYHVLFRLSVTSIICRDRRLDDAKPSTAWECVCVSKSSLIINVNNFHIRLKSHLGVESLKFIALKLSRAFTCFYRQYCIDKTQYWIFGQMVKYKILLRRYYVMKRRVKKRVCLEQNLENGS